MLSELPFTMSASLNDGILVITLAGELDITIRATLAGRLSEALDQQSAQLAYDLTKVPYIDAGTLCLLMRAARRTLRKPVLVCPGPIVSRLLQVTGLDTECIVTHDHAARMTPLGAGYEGQRASASVWQSDVLSRLSCPQGYR